MTYTNISPQCPGDCMTCPYAIKVYEDGELQYIKCTLKINPDGSWTTLVDVRECK